MPREDLSFDTLVRSMSRIRPPSYLGHAEQKSLPLRNGASLTESLAGFVLGGFVSVNEDRTIAPLNVELAFGGVLIAVQLGRGESVIGIVHTRATLYCLCECLGMLGEPVYQLGASPYQRVLSMQPSEGAIQIGTLKDLQPDSRVAHIAMAGYGAKGC